MIYSRYLLKLAYKVAKCLMSPFQTLTTPKRNRAMIQYNPIMMNPKKPLLQLTGHMYHSLNV